jgi:hypothetical protein
VDDLSVSEPNASERCGHCAAPLAHDQRYCLQCGEPRPHLDGPPTAAMPVARQAPAAPPPSAPPPPPVPPGFASPVATAGGSARNNTLALIAGVGVLLLAMGVGVLIGRAGVGTARVPPAQVIAVGGSAPSAATTAPTTSTPVATTPSAPATNKKVEAKAKEPTGAGSSITKPASSSALKSLDKGKESGQSYEEKSKNLPNVVLTK